MADIFDVIADPTRRELLERLRDADGELAVGELVELTGVTQPTVSKHLRVLRDAGLVHAREEGQRRFYTIDPAPLGAVAAWAAAFAPAAASEAQQPAAPDAQEAWSGQAAGEQLGRAAASSLHQAKHVLDRLTEATAEARARLDTLLPGFKGKQ